VGSVEREIAEVDDQIGGGRADVPQHGVPVRFRLRRRAERDAPLIEAAVRGGALR
jgi:hypothetical protein